MRRFIVSMAPLMLVVAASLCAQTKLPTATVWDVEWRNPEGHVYTAELQLQLLGSKAEGSFTWTLRASPRAEEQSKIGMTGVEHVSGYYDSDCGILAFEGHKLDDPNTILGMDKYRLIVDPNGTRIGGLTAHGGTWAGELKGRRR